MPPLWSGFLPPDNPPAAIPEHLRGKHILITGAGGFLGSALARALAPAAAGLVLVDHAEGGLYRLSRKLGTGPAYLLGSVAHPGFLRDAFTRYAPEVVFHAAAHKHVPLVEANPLAAAEANILGTEAALAAARGAERFVLLSTDKAVAPASTMGASKLAAEALTLGAGRTAVRLPNVLGSSGSAAPLFTSQIWRGGPVTVTDAEAERFFLSPRAAVHSLLAADKPGLWIPQTGPARRVEELARHMIARSGREGISIRYTALRPGERLRESLLGPGERASPSPGPLLAVEPAAAQPLRLEAIRAAVASWDRDALLLALQEALPEYAPQ